MESTWKGQVLHKRSASKKLLFVDIKSPKEEGSRVTVVFKVFHCGPGMLDNAVSELFLSSDHSDENNLTNNIFSKKILFVRCYLLATEMVTRKSRSSTIERSCVGG